MLESDVVRHLSDIPRVQAVAHGDAVAVSAEGRSLTYAELDRRSDAAARVLTDLGVRVGDRVGWLCRNNDVFFEVFFGAAKARACLAPINIRLAPAEIAYIVEDSGAEVFFVGADFLDIAQEIAAGFPRPLKLVAIEGEREGWRSYQAIRDAAPATPLGLETQDDDDVLQLYTSGTTGLPKGVRLTNANYRYFLEVSPSIEGFDYRRAETILIVMPLFHVAGTNVSFAGLANSCRDIILAEFRPAEVLRLIQAERVAHMFLVPAMIQMLMLAPEIEGTDLSSLRTIAYGASPISEAVLAAAKARFGCGFVQFYGMTESAGAGTYLPPSAHTPDRLRSCGLPWPGMEVKVRAPGGGEAEPGIVGEIALRGGAVMKGYWNRPEATAEAVTDGWLLTGDAGYRDEAGYLYIHDRVKDMIVSGGENIYPAEVENALFGCPGVADVAVIGVPSERWGEEVKAVVVLAPGAAPDAAAVVAWARGRIAGFKAPKTVDFVDALPRNSSGKVLRRELRAAHWSGRDRAVA